MNKTIGALFTAFLALGALETASAQSRVNNDKRTAAEASRIQGNGALSPVRDGAKPKTNIGAGMFGTAANDNVGAAARFTFSIGSVTSQQDAQAILTEVLKKPGVTVEDKQLVEKALMLAMNDGSGFSLDALADGKHDDIIIAAAQEILKGMAPAFAIKRALEAKGVDVQEYAACKA